MTSLEFGDREVHKNELKVSGATDAGERELVHHDREYVVAQAKVTGVNYPESKEGIGRVATATLEDLAIVEGDLAADVIKASKEITTGLVVLLSEHGEAYMLGQWFKAAAEGSHFAQAEHGDEAGIRFMIQPFDPIVAEVRELNTDLLGGVDWTADDNELSILEERLDALAENLAAAKGWARRRRYELTIAEQEARRVTLVDGTVATPAEAAEAAGETPDDEWPNEDEDTGDEAE